jgi:hypothetical protein
LFVPYAVGVIVTVPVPDVTVNGAAAVQSPDTENVMSKPDVEVALTVNGVL